MSKKIDVALVLAGVMISATAFSAAPVKPAPSPGVALITDALGNTVGPLVPVIDTVLQAAALYRTNGNSVKVLFKGAATYASRNDAASNRTLRVVGPFKVYFPLSPDCSSQGYLIDTDLMSEGTDGVTYTAKVAAKEVQGYAPLAVYPGWPNRTTKPALVSISFAPLPPYPGMTGSVFTQDGECSPFGAATIPNNNGETYAVTFQSELNLTGPYLIK